MLSAVVASTGGVGIFHHPNNERRHFRLRRRQLAQKMDALTRGHHFALYRIVGALLQGGITVYRAAREEGIAALATGLAQYRAIGAQLYVPFFLSFLAEGYRQQGKVGEALQVVNDALSLTAGVLGLVCPPTPAQAIEREGTMLFLSFEELQDALRFPSFSLFPLGTASSLRPDWHEGDSRVERNIRWGNGLGVDGYGTPGTRRSLWGY
jgi:hypothetical protein